MNPSSTAQRIGSLLAITIGITIADSYVPHELTLVRQLLAIVQLGLMAAIVVLTLGSLLRDF